MGTMMSEGFLEYASGRLAVSPEVKATLPNVLIDFLWNIVLCEKWKTHENQTLILEVGELNVLKRWIEWGMTMKNGGHL